MPESVENILYYMDEAALTSLATAILNKVNSRIAQRIVATIDADSDGAHVPSAQAVYKLVQTLKHASMMAVDEEPENPEEDVIYLVKVDDNSRSMRIYLDGAWVNMGTTDVSLDNVWKKDDIDAMKEALGLNNLWTPTDENVASLKAQMGLDLTAPTEAKIASIVDAAFTASAPALGDEGTVDET